MFQINVGRKKKKLPELSAATTPPCPHFTGGLQSLMRTEIPQRSHNVFSLEDACVQVHAAASSRRSVWWLKCLWSYLFSVLHGADQSAVRKKRKKGKCVPKRLTFHATFPPILRDNLVENSEKIMSLQSFQSFLQLLTRSTRKTTNQSAKRSEINLLSDDK